ncbi:hypothetical protein K402DRAFT_398268 [Aulographum hederae CBS 113979]|uniref:Mid2 domain-containing protein n=1 Tax=Aulographum hederae CBS 113979 TaxID=1176131 RepID=A0A6G1GLM8_9PEZI|nr:hypothetical protein K402DRAFT_398268 [Aulographum hederae CBS 113979]
MARFHLRSVSLIAFQYLFALVASQNQSCYWYDQTRTEEDPRNPQLPCTDFKDRNGDSACCSPNDFCTSNNFCISSTRGSFYRGACTRRDWNSNNCPHVCTDDPFACISGRCIISKCGGETFQCGWSGQYNCSSDPTFSAATNEPIRLQVLPGMNGVAEAEFVVANVSGSGSGTCTSPGGKAGCSNGATIGVGVGLGVPLLLAIATILYLLFAQRKKYRALSPGDSTPLPGYQGQGATPTEGRNGHTVAQEAAGKQKVELPTDGEHYELPAR